MATTGSPANIPLLGDQDPITPIQAPINAVAVALNNALKIPTASLIQTNVNYTVSGTRIWRDGGYVYVTLVASRVADIAAGASEAVGQIPDGFLPPKASPYLATGTASGTTAPVAIPIQVAADGTITVFNAGGNHRNFSGTFFHATS